MRVEGVEGMSDIARERTVGYGRCKPTKRRRDLEERGDFGWDGVSGGARRVGGGAAKEGGGDAERGLDKLRDVSLVAIRTYLRDFRRGVEVPQGLRAERFASSEGETQMSVVLVVVRVLEREKLNESWRQTQGDDFATKRGLNLQRAAEKFQSVQWDWVFTIDQRRAHREQVLHQELVQVVRNDFSIETALRGDIQIQTQWQQEFVDELQRQETSFNVRTSFE